jgi:hypothetical protein
MRDILFSLEGALGKVRVGMLKPYYYKRGALFEVKGELI